MITLSGILFRSGSNKKLAHSDPRLAQKAKYVTITFVDQKNGKKMDSRTQRKTGGPVLCPILRWASAVSRVLDSIPSANGSTPICSTRPVKTTLLIHNDFVRHLLRFVCSYLRLWSTRYRKQVHPIWHRNVPLSHEPLRGKNHDPRTMVVRRLFGLHPPPSTRMDQQHVQRYDQTRYLFDATHDDSVAADDPCLQQRLLQSFNGRDSVVVIPRFHLHH
jgi:hypothetical protein